MINMAGVVLFSLILMRMTGFVFLNPVLGRSNIPSIVKAGFTMVLAVHTFVFFQGEYTNLAIPTTIAYGGLLIKEFLIGAVVAYVMHLFFFIATYAGSIIDFNVGLSMATVYDPQTNISASVNSNVLNLFMLGLFLAINGHETLLRILLESGMIVPYGAVGFNPAMTNVILDMFKDCVVLSVQLALPILAFEMLMEVGVGVLMKMIPQINVFIVNIQAKILLGLLLFLILISPIGQFLQDAIVEMLGNVRQVLTLFR